MPPEKCGGFATWLAYVGSSGASGGGNEEEAPGAKEEEVTSRASSTGMCLVTGILPDSPMRTLT